MPGEDLPFTLSSILFRPHQKPAALFRLRALVVEAPGTAPGSEEFITTVVFIAIAVAGNPNIG
jgi:hypothetical protein